MLDSRPSVVCSIAEVRTLLDLHLDASPDLASAIPPLMLWGPPGVGKSAVIRALCQQRGIGFVDVRLSQREPVDLRGLPVPRGDLVAWLLSSEWPRDPDKPSDRRILECRCDLPPVLRHRAAAHTDNSGKATVEVVHRQRQLG